MIQQVVVTEEDICTDLLYLLTKEELDEDDIVELLYRGEQIRCLIEDIVYPEAM